MKYIYDDICVTDNGNLVKSGKPPYKSMNEINNEWGLSLIVRPSILVQVW